jgi:hypothetical protein
MPNEQKVIIDCSQEKTHYEIEKLNNLYRMINTRTISAGNSADIFISRNFLCNYAVADNKDYGKVTIRVEFADKKYGIKTLIIEGHLKAGGTLDIVRQEIIDTAFI